MPDDPRLVMYTIYVDPRDYPGKVVVRRWFVPGRVPGEPEADPEPLIVTETVAIARDAIQDVAPGLACLSEPGVDTCVLETWL